MQVADWYSTARIRSAATMHLLTRYATNHPLVMASAIGITILIASHARQVELDAVYTAAQNGTSQLVNSFAEEMGGMLEDLHTLEGLIQHQGLIKSAEKHHTIRVRLEIGESIHAEKGVRRVWLEVPPSIANVDQLLAHVQRNFALSARADAVHGFRVSIDGFEVPHRQPLSILRDGDLLHVEAKALEHVHASGVGRAWQRRRHHLQDSSSLFPLSSPSSFKHMRAVLTSPVVRDPHFSRNYSTSKISSTNATFDLPSPVPVWVWLENQQALPHWIRLNLAALKRHAPSPSFRVAVLNRSTLYSYVPDLPSEFARLRRGQASADIARIAILATHGGIFVDPDVLVAQSLTSIAAILQENVDVVVPARPLASSTKCGEQFFTSLLAARPQTSLFMRAWQQLREQLRRKCRVRAVSHFVCCYHAQNMSALSECRTPQGLAERILERLLLKLVEDENNPLRVHCFAGHTSLTPVMSQGGIRSSGKHCKKSCKRVVTSLGRPSEADRRCFSYHHIARLPISGPAACYTCNPPDQTPSTICCGRERAHLVCNSSSGSIHSKNVVVWSQNFFNRTAYILLESLNGPAFAAHPRIERSDMAVAPLYRQAIGLSEDATPPEAPFSPHATVGSQYGKM